MRFFGQYLEGFPVHTIDLSNPQDKARYDRFVGLVQQMLSLHKRLAEANIPHDKTVLQQQLTITDQQIDRLVYELYGLTEAEIRIVEGI